MKPTAIFIVLSLCCITRRSQLNGTVVDVGESAPIGSALIVVYSEGEQPVAVAHVDAKGEI